MAYEGTAPPAAGGQMSPVTQLLEAARNGDPHAAAGLLPLV